jgi:hypothetical protein
MELDTCPKDLGYGALGEVSPQSAGVPENLQYPLDGVRLVPARVREQDHVISVDGALMSNFRLPETPNDPVSLRFDEQAAEDLHA